LVAASIAASCGEGVSSQRGPNADPETHLAAAKKLSGAKEDAANAHAKAKKANGRYSSEAAVAEMSVFSRPRTEQDALPNSFAYLLKDSCDDRLRAEGRCPGDAIAAESRLLLTDLGEKDKPLCLADDEWMGVLGVGRQRGQLHRPLPGGATEDRLRGH
jgi:hypothetical protein